MSRVTKTLEPLPQINSDQMAFPWMSFAEDSPAKTSHTQGGGRLGRREIRTMERNRPPGWRVTTAIRHRGKRLSTP